MSFADYRRLSHPKLARIATIADVPMAVCALQF